MANSYPIKWQTAIWTISTNKNILYGVLISELFWGSLPVDSLSKHGSCWMLLSQKTSYHEKKDKLHLYAKHWKKLTHFRVENDFNFFVKKKKTSSKNNTGSRLSFFFFDWNAAMHKEKRVFPPADRAPWRLTSHRAYLSSVLRRDALGFIPREKVAGSPVDQHTPLSLELCEKKCKGCARDANWFTTYSMQRGIFTICCYKGKRQVVMYRTHVAQFMAAYIFILACSLMQQNFMRYSTSASIQLVYL